ncbi:MAG: RNA polymerase sporulation sigma factor SigH [Actinobacteria bacterium]|nr:RNA polymerase sporulation sigma factor SigH [Actinomycetota bacterium]
MALRLDDPALTDLSDEDLAFSFQAGDVTALNALLGRYRGFARAKARGYFLIGADSDDIEQEGLIGLYKAARDYRPDREASFRAFAELCITRQIITAIKTATRQKHQPLNSYVSLSSTRASDDSAGERTVEESLESREINDPADLVVGDESFRSMRSGMLEQLSGLEVRVLHLYVSGKTYQEIAGELGRHVKSIDNALQRIKRKLDAQLVERDAAERTAEADLDAAVA